jgi:hypothetical protein
MNSKTLEMLQKFVGEEDNEDFENLGEKINIFGEQSNDNNEFDNEFIAKNDDINRLFEKINNLENEEIDENKIFNIKENENINNNEEEEKIDKNINDVDEDEKENNINSDKSGILLKMISIREKHDFSIYFMHWKQLNLINQEKESFEKEEINNNNIENINNNKNPDNSKNNINEENKEIKNEKEKEELQNNESKNNDNSLEQILQAKEDDLEDHLQNDIITQHQNQLLKSDTNNFHNINTLDQIGDINLDIFTQNKTLPEINTNQKSSMSLIALSLYNKLKNKLFIYKKILFSSLKHITIISNYHDKLYQLDKLNKKYEAILDEKSSIIINKTDEMEELKETIEKLKKNLKEANKKNQNLNVIQESLCSKCGGSLEESFTGDVIAENQKIIKEQNDTIDKMKKEMNELRSKYNLAEIKINDLNNIKKEFENLSGSLLNPKIDKESQTDDSLTLTNKNSGNNLKNNSSNNSNINIQIYNNNINSNNKNISISNTKKGSKKKTIPKKVNFSNSTNNYMSTSLGPNKNSKNNNININENNSEVNNELVTSLRYDNSVLSNELLNLNREFNKIRNEHKVLKEKNTTLEKEKKDLIEKLKSKSDLSEKYKKENEDITRMINNTKYKNIINAETENKKLKNILEQNDTDIKKLKNMNEKCAKKILEQNNQIEKMKTALGSLLNLKQQKDKLIIENNKYENEIKTLKEELEEEKNRNEKNEVLIENKDKEIEKLNNDVKYYSFHIKKYKSDAERALEDAIGYQKIVRILEIQLNENKEELKKMKNKNHDEG